MQGATGRMQELIRGLLAYSRLNTEKPSFRSVALNPLVNEILSDLETAINDRQATIEVGLLPDVRGNAIQLRQLFQNLLSNALKLRPLTGLHQYRSAQRRFRLSRCRHSFRMRWALI